MIVSSNQLITIVRGDTTDISLSQLLDSVELQTLLNDLTEYDVIKLGILTQGSDFEEAEITKTGTVSTSNVSFHLTSAETKTLYEGKYYYCIKRFNSAVSTETRCYTIINKRIFQVT